MVIGDIKPFTEAESHFADAKFYVEGASSSEFLPTKTSPTRNDEFKSVGHKQSSTSETCAHDCEKPSIVAPLQELPSHSRTSVRSQVFKYVPMSCRKQGESPFVEMPKDTEDNEKSRKGMKTEDLWVLKESSTVPLTNIRRVASSKTSPIKFVKPSGVPTEQGNLPNKRTAEGFDPKAYKLMAKSGYDFSNPAPLGVLSPESTGERVHGLTETQAKLRQQGHAIIPLKTGLGFTSKEPIWVPIKNKCEDESSQYITAEEVVEEDESHHAPRLSVFDRIGTSSTRASVFSRLSTAGRRNDGPPAHARNSSRTSVFHRLGNLAQVEENQIPRQRTSVFSRIDSKDRPLKSTSDEHEGKVEDKEDTETRSLVPSRMRRRIELDVIADDMLKVKRRTIVLTNHVDIENKNVTRRKK